MDIRLDLRLDEELTIKAGCKGSSEFDWQDRVVVVSAGVTVLLGSNAENVQGDAWRVELVVATNPQLMDDEVCIAKVAEVHEYLIGVAAGLYGNKGLHLSDLSFLLVVLEVMTEVRKDVELTQANSPW